MSSWTPERVALVLGCSSLSGPPFSSISTDTRTLHPGALFVALTGDNFDGHTFLDRAVDAGATGVVVDLATLVPNGVKAFHVDDTLVAYGRLAREVRRGIAGPVVAVTGTNGKTSTKEMLKAALGTRWSVHATAENLNNRVGVPQTILSAPAETQALVVEAGANEPGEIAALREIIEPTVAVVTNVSPGHLSGFGSLEGVLEEKTSLLQDVSVAVVGTNPDALARVARGRAKRVVSAGLNGADFSPDEMTLNSNGTATLTFGKHVVRLALPGKHQAENATLVWAVARELGLDLSAVAKALESAVVLGGRCEVLIRGKMKILHDAYNANPASLKAVLETAQSMRGERRLVVTVGTMLELGEDSGRMHEEAAQLVAEANPVLVGAVGEFVKPLQLLAKGADWELVTADDAATLGRELKPRLLGDELLVVKGSRGMRMERLLLEIEREG